MSTLIPQSDGEQLRKMILEHRHTGLDSAPLRLEELVASPGELTEANDDAVGNTYSATEAGVIVNLRTRLNELEAILQGLGILK